MAAARALWRLLGPVPDVGVKNERLLVYVSFAFLWELYDLSLAMSAMSMIAVDLNADAQAITYAHTIIRLGSLPALLTASSMDHFGRKACFIAAVTGLSLATCATAFAQSLAQYVALQVICRVFVELCSAAGFVIVSEEFPAEHRGWGMGMLGAMGAVGFGVGAVLFSLVDVLPFTWRALYLVGCAPLLLVPVLRKELPETSRFRRMKKEGGCGGGAAHDDVSPVLPPRDSVKQRSVMVLLTGHPVRALTVAIACLSFTVANVPVFQFCGYHVLHERQWAPWQLSTMLFLAGAASVWGNSAIGRHSDAWGRRPIAFAMALAFPIPAYVFYTARSSVLMYGAWVLLTLCNVSLNVLLRAIGTEIFPTDCRGAAGGLVATCNALGGVLGLFTVARGVEAGYALTWMLTSVSWLIVVAGCAFLLLPETSGCDLDALHNEAGDPLADVEAPRSPSGLHEYTTLSPLTDASHDGSRHAQCYGTSTGRTPRTDTTDTPRCP